MIKQISESQNTRIPSAVLNGDVIMDAIAINPTPTDKRKTSQDLLCDTEWQTKPPTFVVFVNEEELMSLLIPRFLEVPNSQAGLCFEGTSNPIWLRENGSREYETNGSKGEGYFKW